ncbi:hypothetical protein MASR1M8_11780 [Thermomonas brevis]
MRRIKPHILMLPTMRGMARSRFHRHASRIALLAMLLLAVLPTLGRLLQPPAQSEPLLVAMCTTLGLETRALPSLLTGSEQAPATPDHAGEDCAYCPLLSTLAFVAAAIAIAFHASRPNVAITATFPPRQTRHPCGLGSRGPPLAA